MEEPNITDFNGFSKHKIDQFRYIKIQPNTIDLRTWLWGINPTNSVVIPQSFVLRSSCLRLNFNISKLVY